MLVSHSAEGLGWRIQSLPFRGLGFRVEDSGYANNTDSCEVHIRVASERV